MKRREFMLSLSAAIAAADPLYAQQKAMPVIGSLSLFSPPANPADRVRGPIHQGMSEMGFVEGQNMTWEYRWAEFHFDRLPALAADLVSLNVDLILTSGGASPALAAKNATSTIPIVFTGVGDPVGFGLVASLSRPGGNVTGFSELSVELEPKRLELLCELVPGAALIALLVNPDSMVVEQHVRATEEAAREGGKTRCPKGQQRQRDRGGLRPIACRRAPRWRRCVSKQPAQPARGAGSALRRSGDPLVPSIRRSRRPGQLWR